MVGNDGGLLLEELTWPEAEQFLTSETVIVVPLGAASKEHGRHLKLKNDWLIAEYLKKRLLETETVVVAPTVSYHYYPAFTEYPGSVSLSFETARDLIVEICRSLAQFGPSRFYVLNTGISTVKPLAAAAELLSADGILLAYTNLSTLLAEVIELVSEQDCGSHADEVETSMMLYMCPEHVDMDKAVKDCSPDKAGGLTRSPHGQGVYSESGVWGDATLATVEKGKKLVEHLVAEIKSDIEKLRASSS